MTSNKFEVISAAVVMMLWFDNDPKTDLAAKVKTAAAYFEKKYGCKPTVCHVNPVVEEQEICGVQVVPDNVVLKDHYLIGVSGSPAKGGIDGCSGTV